MIYLFDENVIINFFKLYPKEVFSKLHDDIQKIIDEGRIFCVDSMFDNLSSKNKDDEMQKFLKQNKEIFLKPTEPEFKFIKDELFTKQHYRGKLITNQDVLAPKSDISDPYLVAKSHLEKHTLVTDEGQNKMPLVCKDFNIKCIDRLNFFVEENLKY